MAQGTAALGECWSTQAEAGTMFCSQQSGVSSAGNMACSGITNGSTTAGGGFTLLWSQVLYPSAGGANTTTNRATALLACETYDYDYWSPAIAAWVAAAVAIVAAKMIYTRVFKRETL